MINEKQQDRPEYIRALDAARMIGIARPTFYTYLKKPELEMPRGIKLGGAVVYSVAELDAWMQKRRMLSVAA
jgi:predicted DNA-binding transcriptional regulator AlpA